MVYDIAIVGGGIVGLATGMKILKSRPELKIAVFEKENGWRGKGRRFNLQAM